MDTPRSSKTVLITAWVVILLVALYKIVLQELFDFKVDEDLQFAISGAIVLAGFGLTFLWKAIRLLRSFFGLFLVLFGAQWLILSQLEEVPFIRQLLVSPSFSVYMPTEVVLKLLVTFIIIAFLYMLKGRRQAFFLTRGDLAAPVEPVRWLGIKAGERWNTVGRIFAVILSLGTLAFLVIAGGPPLNIATKALPFLPAILVAAALNAFNEEMTYKASFLAVLEDVVGKQPALWMMAAFFGIWHFYGIPYGVVGVILATFLGWLLGKSMLETRGLFWAWFLHFLQDIWIFAFLAIGSVNPGG
jgi:hypothetical protein